MRLAAVLPSRDEPSTITGVAEAADQALASSSARIINIDSSGDRRTHQAFTDAHLRASQLGLPGVPQGKGAQALRGLTEAGEADCVLMVDTDTRNPSPVLYRRLVAAVHAGADLALLDYRRAWSEANLTNHIARPLIAATAGIDIPQPIVGDIALSPRGVRTVLAEYQEASGELRPCIDGYGIDAFITRTIARHGTTVSVPTTTAKRHAPSFPHLPAIFHEAVPVLLHATGTSAAPSVALRHPACTLARDARPPDTVRDMRHRLLALLAETGHTPGSLARSWPQPLSEACHQVCAGTPPTVAARTLWPAYLDRVQSYLAIASLGGRPAAERTLAAAMSTFLATMRLPS